MSTTYAPITREYLKKVSSDQMKKEIRDPARLAEINAFLTSPEAINFASELTADLEENSPVEQTSLEHLDTATEAVMAAQAETDRIAAEKAQMDAVVKAAEEEQQAEAFKAAGVTVLYNDAGSITKLIQEYQVVDDSGNPIGRTTHLEARSWVELVTKQREAHTQATRAFSRLKNQKTTFKAPVAPIAIPVVPLLSEADRIQAALDLTSSDEDVVIKADRKLRADDIMIAQRNKAIQAEENRQSFVSNEFKLRHINDFNPCQANSKIITDYLEANNLEWTTDNLELAFAATEPQLAPKEVKEAPVAEVPAVQAVNPPAAPQALPPAPAAAIQPALVTAALEVPVAVVPAAPAPAANPQAPARRPGVNGGLEPGQMSAARPVSTPVGLTKKDIAKWTAEQMRKEMKNPARKAEIYKVLGQKVS